ncbi:hypothetical protein MESS4_50023 [Mesorhizobium sp. STM 4661]|nr:hypothetical protein MESS4_50023 [Mesorhizobium sp. STM 4661]
MKPGGGPTRRPGNSAITATAATAAIRGRGQFQFYRKSRSGSSAFQNETRASTGLAVTSKERNRYLSQLRVGKDPVTADVEKYQSIVVGCSHAGKTGAVVSVAPANNAADSVAARRVLTVTLSLSNALQQIRQTSLQTLCELKSLTMIRSL